MLCMLGFDGLQKKKKSKITITKKNIDRYFSPTYINSVYSPSRDDLAIPHHQRLMLFLAVILSVPTHGPVWLLEL